MGYTEFTLVGDHQHAMNVVGSTIVDAFEQIVNAVGAATTQAGIYLGATAD